MLKTHSVLTLWQIHANSAILESPWYPFGVRKNFGKADVIIKTSTAEDEAAPEVGLDLDAQQKAGWALLSYLLLDHNCSAAIQGIFGLWPLHLISEATSTVGSVRARLLGYFASYATWMHRHA